MYRAKNVRIVSMSQYLWTWLYIYIYISFLWWDGGGLLAAVSHSPGAHCSLNAALGAGLLTLNRHDASAKNIPQTICTLKNPHKTPQISTLLICKNIYIIRSLFNFYNNWYNQIMLSSNIKNSHSLIKKNVSWSNTFCRIPQMYLQNGSKLFLNFHFSYDA